MKPRSKRIDYHAEEKRRQRKILYFSLFMVALMVFSVLEVLIYRGDTGSTTQMKYGKYEFVYHDLGNGAGVLVTQINGQEVEFQNLPVQVAELNISPAAIDLLKGAQQIALSADPNTSVEDAAMVDYARLELGLAVPDKMFNAMSQEDARYKLPVIDCSKASPQMAVVLFNATNETSVVLDGNCLVVNAAQRDLMRVKDRIIFEYYDILKDGQVPGS
jgi:hypothetical protein